MLVSASRGDELPATDDPDKSFAPAEHTGVSPRCGALDGAVRQGSSRRRDAFANTRDERASAPANTERKKVKDQSRANREKALKPRATASPRGGVGSSPRRASQSATQVNLIRPDEPTSLLANGEVERRAKRRGGKLTSHGNGRCHWFIGWLRAEWHGRVFRWKQGELPCQQRAAAVRASVVAQASRAHITGGTSASAERRRLIIAGAKGGRKVERP